jgi:mono/diheme cytochrome c family protein
VPDLSVPVYNGDLIRDGAVRGSQEAMVHERSNLHKAAGGSLSGCYKRLGQAVTALLGCLLMTGCATAPPRQSTPVPPRAPIPAASSPEALAGGARLYQQHCVPCHGEEGRSGIAAPLDQYGHAWHHPDSVLTQTIREGTGPARNDLATPDIPMPAFGVILTPEEIRTLVAFFKASWTPDQQRLQWERTERADIQPY